MYQIFDDKLAQCNKNRQLIAKKLQIINEANKPILKDIEGIEQQNYQPQIQQNYEISTQQYLKNVKAQVKQIDSDIKNINKKAEVLEKQYKKEERKRQDEKLFKQPIIKSKQQLANEKQARENQKLDAFINDIVAKYSPYLKQPEKLNKEQQQQKLLYQKQYENYKSCKLQNDKIQKGLISKEKKPFNLVTTKNNWLKQQEQIQSYPLEQDIIVNPMQQEIIQREDKIEQTKKNNKKQQLYFELLNEKLSKDRILFKKHYNSLINKIFKCIDKERTGYISKEEVLDYFSKNNVYIDIFEINWIPFREFVIKIKANRKGLLNKAELIEILKDKKLQLEQEQIAEKILSKNKSEYLINDSQDLNEEQEQKCDQYDNDTNQFQRDNQIEYQQLNEISEINKEFQDLNYPIYHQELDQKKITFKDEKNKNKKQHNLNPEFIKFDNDIYSLQQQYNQGNIKFLQNEDIQISLLLKKN